MAKSKQEAVYVIELDFTDCAARDRVFDLIEALLGAEILLSATKRNDFFGETSVESCTVDQDNCPVSCPYDPPCVYQCKRAVPETRRVRS